MLAATLWLGNISFQVTDIENHIEVVDDEGKIHSVCIMPFDGLLAPCAVLLLCIIEFLKQAGTHLDSLQCHILYGTKLCFV